MKALTEMKIIGTHQWENAVKEISLKNREEIDAFFAYKIGVMTQSIYLQQFLSTPSEENKSSLEKAANQIKKLMELKIFDKYDYDYNWDIK